MLILTEKPSVAKDFAAVLGCSYQKGIYSDSSDRVQIINCVGHLFKLYDAENYDIEFRDWKKLPVIPSTFGYRPNPQIEVQTKLVVSMLKSHKTDKIIIATDADREGEVIARECLAQAGITDFSNIKRFWVSQALTSEVITEGLDSAKPLNDYNSLAENGFARQHSDWLCGINFTRYISTAAEKKLPVGRVQTAVLAAIADRCSNIENFVSTPYFQYSASFGKKDENTFLCKGLYLFIEKDGKETVQFTATEPPRGGSDFNLGDELQADTGKQASLVNKKTEKRELAPPQLYNLNAVQKDAFRQFSYSADRTLEIIQKLYEEYKCVSYPRTPSKVMGSQNVQLCREIFSKFARQSSETQKRFEASDITSSNKRCFNDTKLEAHHALIPLKELPDSASEDESNIFNLILDRFTLAFLPVHMYNLVTFIIKVGSHNYKIKGRSSIDEGWKNFIRPSTWRFDADEEKDVEEQNIGDIDWNNFFVKNVEKLEKHTKPPKYFNEASILSFMENPRGVSEENGKLLGLGTQATRHTFIPKLLSSGYIEKNKKNIIVTPLGRSLLNAVRSSPIKSLADVAETTGWENRLEENPAKFENDIKNFVRISVSTEFKIDKQISRSNVPVCPLCGRPVRKGKSNWFCSGYKEGCKFVVWENIAGAKVTQSDVAKLCSGKKSGLKHCVSKNGKNFDTYFVYEKKDNKVIFVFPEK